MSKERRAADDPSGHHRPHAGGSQRPAEQFILSFKRIAAARGRMTPAERFLVLGRALGRAAAHEIGHYLMRSKTHTTRGLMKGRRTVKALIDVPRRTFEIDAADREAAARRIREITRA